MRAVPRVLRRPHHRIENLVVVAAAAQIARQSAGELRARGIRTTLEKADRAHDEARHAERALESLFVDNRALNRMQRSIGARQTLDRQDAAAAYGVSQHRARVAGDVVDEDGARPALRPIAAEFRAGEAQLVAERPRQRFLFAYVNPSLLSVDVEGEQPVAHAGLCE